MNFKYYLRGLGLGIIASALVLGIHFYRTTDTMSDDEVRERAAELGMVDGSATLSSDDEDMSAEDLLESMNDDSDTASEGSDASETPSVIAADDEKDSTAGSAETVEADAEASAEDTDTAEKPDSKGDEDAAGGQDSDEGSKEASSTASEITSVADADDDPDRVQSSETVSGDGETAAADTANSGKTQTLTINSGDSSYGVAKKLAELGLVDDASDYDLYLCNNGYDRYIRTGSFTISEGASQQEIAKTITGR